MCDARFSTVSTCKLCDLSDCFSPLSLYNIFILSRASGSALDELQQSLLISISNNIVRFLNIKTDVCHMLYYLATHQYIPALLSSSCISTYNSTSAKGNKGLEPLTTKSNLSIQPFFKWIRTTIHASKALSQLS